MPYDSYISRGLSPDWDEPDPSVSPLVPIEVKREIIKDAKGKSKAFKMFTRKPKGTAKGSRRK
jgi:hypothetical protein